MKYTMLSVLYGSLAALKMFREWEISSLNTLLAAYKNQQLTVLMPAFSVGLLNFVQVLCKQKLGETGEAVFDERAW